MEKNIELKEAIEILNNYLCETHRKFCSIGAVGIPNKEYFAIEIVLNHITKQEKMIELMALALAETEFDKCCDYCHTDVCTAHDDVDERAVCIKQYFEKKAEESE